MTTLYLVTHAEATHHVDNRVGGWFDSKLTARGHTAARQIANELQNRVSATPQIFSSDLQRALQTAKPIAQAFSSTIESHADLREASCGIAEGQTNAWLSERFTLPPTEGDRLDHLMTSKELFERYAIMRSKEDMR